MGLHRFLLRRRTLFVLAVIVGVTATDWPIPILNGFWRDHPIVTGVVSGILLLVFAAIVVEGWLEQREAERWLPIADVAYRALANEARDVRVRLEHYVNGPTASWWPADQGIDASGVMLHSAWSCAMEIRGSGGVGGRGAGKRSLLEGELGLPPMHGRGSAVTPRIVGSRS